MDLLNFGHLNTEEDLAIIETTKLFVSSHFLPKVAESYENGQFPVKLIPEMAKLGFLGAGLTGYGCSGLNSKQYGLLLQELEAGDSGLRSFVSVQGSLAMQSIYDYGNESQKSKWLPQMAAGEVIGCFGLTEPDFGSDAGGMLTTVKKKGNKLLLNGSKMWITNGCISKIAVVWAKDDNQNIGAWIVDLSKPGVKVSKIKNKWSLRASITSELSFDDVELSPDDQLKGAFGLGAALKILNVARLGIAWGVLGAARSCFEETLSYTQQRMIFGKSLSSFQIPQKKIVLMSTEMAKGRLLVEHVSALKQAGKLEPHHVSMAKMNNCRIALETARECRDLLGANGISYEYVTGRHMMNLETVKTYEGTEDIHGLIIGRKITGKNALTR